MNKYSTKKISKELLAEISHALKTVSDYGSVEIYVQNSIVTQVTVRNIRKTNARSTRDSSIRDSIKKTDQSKKLVRLYKK